MRIIPPIIRTSHTACIFAAVCITVTQAQVLEKTLTIPDEKTVGFDIPKEGRELKLTISPASGKRIESSSITAQDDGDTVVWQASNQNASGTNHVYNIGTVFSSRHWLHVHGTFSQSGPGGAGSGPLPQFDAYAASVDIDAEPALAGQGLDAEATEEECAGIIVPGGPVVTLKLQQKFEVKNVKLEATAGASRVRVYRKQDKTEALTLPYTLQANEKNLTLYAEYLTPASNDTQPLPQVRLKLSGDTDSGTTTDAIALAPIELRDIKNHATSNDDVRIKNWDTTQNIADGNIAWIEAHTSASTPAPQMPQLVFNIFGIGQSVTMEAKLEVNYTRGNGARAARNQPEDTVKIPSNGNFAQISGSSWEIHSASDWNSELSQNGLFGGEATLTYKLKRGQSEISTPQTIRFRIGGRNPDSTRARTYIESLPNAGASGSLWFAYAVAKHESANINGSNSRYNQFLQLPVHTKDAGRPVWGNDGGTLPGGYGMFQLTGSASNATANIPRKQIWNWQENAAGAISILSSKRSTAVSWMTQQKNANNANGAALPDHIVGIVTFSEGTARTMTHAVTIKLYNGASRAPQGFVDSGTAPGFFLDPQGSGHYCFWRNASNEWALNRYNNPPSPIQPFNYVSKVCSEVEN